MDFVIRFLMEDFLPRFFPVFTATFLGVLLSFALNRLIERKSERKQRRADIRQLNRALDAIVGAIKYNRERLCSIRDTLSDQQINVDPALDYSTWEAVKRDIVQHLHDPELQRRIAFHFSRAKAIHELNDMLFNYTAGVGSAYSQSERLSDHLRSYMEDHVSRYIEISDQLLSAIAQSRVNMSEDEA